jgi:hypothetical protein
MSTNERNVTDADLFRIYNYRYAAPCIISLSLVGNTLVILIYMRDAFKKKSIAFYSIMLSVTNTLCCLLFIRLILKNGYEIRYEKSSSALCKLDLYSIYALTPISAYILAMIAFDRMIGILCMHNGSNKILKSRVFQFVAVLTIAALNLSAYSPLIIFHELKPIQLANTTINETHTQFTLNSCDLEPPSVQKILNWFDLFNSTVVPFSLMIVFTLVIIGRLYAKRRQLMKTKATNNKSKSKDRNFAIVSIAMTLIFLLLNLPYVIFQLVVDSLDESQGIYFGTVSIDLFYINMGALFWINIFFNKLFNKEFSTMIACQKRLAKGSLTKSRSLIL